MLKMKKKIMIKFVEQMPHVPESSRRENPSLTVILFFPLLTPSDLFSKGSQLVAASSPSEVNPQS